MKKAILLCALITIAGCQNEKDIVCNQPLVSSGDMELINRQCVDFGKNYVVGFVEFKNIKTNQHFFYTVNAVGGHAVLNLDTSKAIAIKNSEDAEASANMAVAMSAASVGMSSGK